MKTLFHSLLFSILISGSLPASAATVTTLADSGPGSLRAAVAAGGSVTFGVTGTVTLTSGEIAIVTPVVIAGPGADQLIIQRSTEPGTPEFRIFNIRSFTEISGVTISNGRIGAADEYDEGAGILVNGPLTLRNCVISDNGSEASYLRGGGLCNRGGPVEAIDCSFIRNSGTGFCCEGAAIYNYGTLLLTNCTFSGNWAGYSGGAIHCDGYAGGAWLESCTVVSNYSRFAGGLMNRGGFSPASDSEIWLRNCIVAGNVSGPECPGIDIENTSRVASLGYNLIGFVRDQPLALHFTDQIGLTADDLRLGPLAENGSSLPTHALLPGSRALNAGPGVDFPNTDQRGVARPAGGRVDIGAFESAVVPELSVICPPPIILQSTAGAGVPATLTAAVANAGGSPVTLWWFIDGIAQQTNQLTPSGNPPSASVTLTALFSPGIHDVTALVSEGSRSATAATAVWVQNTAAPNTFHVHSIEDRGYGTLRQVIGLAPSNSTIMLSVTGAVNLVGGELKISRPLTLLGPGADRLSIQRSYEPGTRDFRIFRIQGGPVTIAGVTIRNGRLSSEWDDDGAGIFNWSELTLRDCVIRDNISFVNDTRGIGLCSMTGTSRVVNCTIVNNRAEGLGGEGGGIYNWWAFTALTNCTISGNSSMNGSGGIQNDAYAKGLIIHSCTIVSNAGPQGAGLYSSGYAGEYARPLFIKNTIVAANIPRDEYSTEVDNAGIFVSGGHNLFGRMSTGADIQTNASDRFSVTADQLQIGPLQDNGGTTPTHALLPASIALDAGDDTDCLPTDQRGVARPHYAACDIGAYEADLLPPLVTCPPALRLECNSSGSFTTDLAASVTDLDGEPLTVVWVVNGVACQTNLVPAGGPPTTATVSYSAAWPPGTHTVEMLVSDGMFAPVKGTTTVVVGDFTPPQLTCPTNLIVATEAGRCSAQVSYPIPAAVDNCALAAVACHPSPGTDFPKGSTSVICTATDAAGNEASCAFQVTVEDREPPVIQSLQASPIVLWPANRKMVPVRLTVRATDNCGKYTARITDVRCTESISPGDWAVTGPLSLQLRADRNSQIQNRVYSIVVEVRDSAGNLTTTTVGVSVPRNPPKSE